MRHGLDGIGPVKARVRRIDVHVVTHDEVGRRFQVRSLSSCARLFNLGTVVVKPDDSGAGVMCDNDQGSADTAADIQHLHTRLHVQPVCQVRLVETERLLERFAGVKRSEVE